MDDPPSQIVFQVLTALAIVNFLVGGFFAAARASLAKMDRKSIPVFDYPSLSRRHRILLSLLRRPVRLAVGLATGEFLGEAGALLFGTGALYFYLAPVNVSDLLTLILGALAILLMILLVGRVLAVHYLGTPEFARIWSPVLFVLLFIELPIILLVERLVFLLEKPEDYLEKVGAEHLDVWIEQPEDNGELEEEELEMIRSIFEFGDTTVREIMTPRIDLQALEAGTPGVEVLDFLALSPFSRFPVYEKTLDVIVGILHIKDLLKFMREGNLSDLDLRRITRDPHFVPETKRLDDLLREIREHRAQMVIVIDEHGGVSGIVTIEDLLEEIVGEIQDEYDDEGEDLVALDEGGYIVRSRMPIEEFNEALGTSIEGEDFDTVGGLAFARFGRVPEKGDYFQYDGWQFTILSISRNRIGILKVERSPRHGANLERAEADAERRESGGG